MRRLAQAEDATAGHASGTPLERPAAGTPGPVERPLRARRRLNDLVLLPALVALLVLGGLANPQFLTTGNLVNILSASAAVGLLVVAQTIIVISGSFDLSHESTAAFAPAIGTMLVIPAVAGGFGTEWPFWLAFLVMFAVGAAIGLFNGYLIVKLGLNAFILTLAVLIVVRGIQQGLTNSRTLYLIPDQMRDLGTTQWLGLPPSVWLAGVAFLVAELILRYHHIGRAIYAMGGNLEAARLAGIRVDRLRIGIFVVGSMLAVVAGLVLTGYVGAIPPALGKDYLFSVFAAIVVGGVSLQGGRGTMLGALTGVLLLGIVQNLLTLAQVPSYWIQATYGGIILLALVSSRVSSGRVQS